MESGTQVNRKSEIAFLLAGLVLLVAFIGYLLISAKLDRLRRDKDIREKTSALKNLRDKDPTCEEIRLALNLAGIDYVIYQPEEFAEFRGEMQSDWGYLDLGGRNITKRFKDMYPMGNLELPTSLTDSIENQYLLRFKKEEAIHFKEYRAALELQMLRDKERQKEAKAKALADEKQHWGRLWKMHQSHPSWSYEDCKSISKHLIWIGMTVDQMKASWGNPEDVNVSNYGSGNQYQYCYDGQYVYDNNGDGIVDAYN